MDNDALSVKQLCIQRWRGPDGLDKRLKYFDDTFQEWFKQIPQQHSQIVLTLLKHFQYYSRESVNKFLLCLHHRLLQAPNVTDDNTIYAFIKSEDGKSNSSNDYWTEYKLINDINPELCYENMDAITAEQWEYIENIVFIDDFSGSGRSFIFELKRHISRYIHKNVFFIAVNMMAEGQEQIKLFAAAQEINVFLLIGDSQEKAFESGFFQNDMQAKKQISEMSSTFAIPRSEWLGYKKSQSLVAFYNNTPNNTLGFIRYNTDNYRCIFPRKHSTKPSWQNLKHNKTMRKNANYQNRVGSSAGE